MTEREAELEQALKDIQALLEDWPTMRALSATGALKATEKKLAARAVIARVLTPAESSFTPTS